MHNTNKHYVTMNQHRQDYKETSLLLTIYRCVWLVVVAVFIIAMCAWADKYSHGIYPEAEQEAASSVSELR